MNEQLFEGIFLGVALASLIGLVGKEYLEVLRWRKQQFKDIKKSLRDIEFQVNQIKKDNRASL